MLRGVWHVNMGSRDRNYSLYQIDRRRVVVISYDSSDPWDLCQIPAKLANFAFASYWKVNSRHGVVETICLLIRQKEVFTQGTRGMVHQRDSRGGVMQAEHLLCC